MKPRSIARVAYRSIPSGTLLYAAVGKIVSLHHRNSEVPTGVFSSRGGATRKIILPLFETFIAAAIIFPTSSKIARLIGTFFFLVGSLQSAIAIVQHQTRTCNCFGAFTRGTIGRLTFVRNVGLALITMSPNVDLTGTISKAKDPRIANRAILTANIGLGAVLVVLIIRNGISEAMDRAGLKTLHLNVGQSIPHVFVYDTSEAKFDLSKLWEEVEGLSHILFLSGQCLSCREIYERILGSNRLEERILTIWIGANRTEQGSRAKGDSLTNSVRTFYDIHSAASSAFGVKSAPTCIALDRDGRIIDNYHIGKDAIASLLNHL